MRNIRAKSGPFTERPHFKLREIESIGGDALKEVDLYPSTPQPIRVDRFIEKKFKVKVEYEDLPDGVLGFTKFGSRGVEAVVISAALDRADDRVAERRLRGHVCSRGRTWTAACPSFPAR